MTEHSLTSPRRGRRDGPLTRVVGAVAGACARRPRRTIVLWLVLIAGCIYAGAAVGTRTLSDAASGTGQSAQAQAWMASAGLRAPAVENVLIQSASTRTTTRLAAEIERQARALPGVAAVRGPSQSPALARRDGRVALVAVQLRGDPDTADQRVAPLQQVVTAVAGAHRGEATIQEEGPASGGRAINQVVDRDLHHAELISLPITLLILVLAFSAVVAALVPLLLGLTSVAGALGALGVVSQIAPSGQATASVVVLIGLAVGVDYSLFYIRREREERRAGAEATAALTAATATVGRAIVVAALTVMVGLAGLALTGLGVFTSMALGAILVVAIAALGSVTVLPAVLALLGDRIDRGRLWGWRRARRATRAAARHGASAWRPAPAGSRAWRAIAQRVTAHPRGALLVTVALLGALAVPVLGMRTADPGEHDLPATNPLLVAERAVERSFPGAPDTAQLVVRAHDLDSASARAALQTLGRRAEQITGGRGAVSVAVSRDGDTALISAPFADRGLASETQAVAALRSRLGPDVARTLPGAAVRVTGDAARSADFSSRLSTVTPVVIAAVLALAFLLLVAAFGSPRLAVGVIGLNLLSVGAAFGILVAVFQHGLGQRLLGFTSDGAIVEWLPLFAFVVLFGLSMDYTVLILERVREEQRRVGDTRSAVVQAIGATAGTVTSAAAVMIAVFAVFATLGLLEFKQLGFGLAIAILLDATIVRAIALPALVTLVGGRAGARRSAWAGQPVSEGALR